MILDFLTDPLRTPDAQADAYTWGAALLGALGWTSAGARFALAVTYWWAKERGDLHRGGSLRDGLIDAAFVGVGAFYDGSRAWPVAVICTVAFGAWLKERRR